MAPKGSWPGDTGVRDPLALAVPLAAPPPGGYRHLPRSFFTCDAITLARGLLGRLLVSEVRGTRTVGRIVETEAYTGPEDKAAHVRGGTRTARTEVFWREGGYAYVFLVYGIHHCFNVVGGKAGEPCAVLVRALEPVEGVPTMERRRGLRPDPAAGPDARLRHVARLMNGPGKVCQAMGIDLKHYGADLTSGRVRITHGVPVGEDAIAASARVGVDYAQEYAAMPWRFVVRGSPCVSKT